MFGFLLKGTKSGLILEAARKKQTYKYMLQSLLFKPPPCFASRVPNKNGPTPGLPKVIDEAGDPQPRGGPHVWIGQRHILRPKPWLTGARGSEPRPMGDSVDVGFGEQTFGNVSG